MDNDSYLRFVLALVLVLGLLALAAFLLRRSGLGQKLSRSRRLTTLESLSVGPRHRLLLIRRDNVEHLLLLGPQGDLVVERAIPIAAVSTASQLHYPSERDATMPEDRSQEPRLRRFADMIDNRTEQSSAASPIPHPFLTNEPH